MGKGKNRKKIKVKNWFAMLRYHIAKPESGCILIEWSTKIKPVHKKECLNYFW